MTVGANTEIITSNASSRFFRQTHKGVDDTAQNPFFIRNPPPVISHARSVHTESSQVSVNSSTSAGRQTIRFQVPKSLGVVSKMVLRTTLQTTLTTSTNDPAPTEWVGLYQVVSSSIQYGSIDIQRNISGKYLHSGLIHQDEQKRFAKAVLAHGDNTDTAREALFPTATDVYAYAELPFFTDQRTNHMIDTREFAQNFYVEVTLEAPASIMVDDGDTATLSYQNAELLIEHFDIAQEFKKQLQVENYFGLGSVIKTYSVETASTNLPAAGTGVTQSLKLDSINGLITSLTFYMVTQASETAFAYNTYLPITSWRLEANGVEIVPTQYANENRYIWQTDDFETSGYKRDSTSAIAEASNVYGWNFSLRAPMARFRNAGAADFTQLRNPTLYITHDQNTANTLYVFAEETVMVDIAAPSVTSPANEPLGVGKAEVRVRRN